LQDEDIVVQGASPDIMTPTAEQIRSLVEEQVTSSLQKTLPSILKEALANSALMSAPPSTDDQNINDQESKDSTKPVSRLDRFYSSTKECVLSDPVLEVIKTAFSKQLSKDVWSDLMEKYPQIRNTDEILVAPTMETGIKEYIRQKFGHHKTKEILSFDDGLAERQAPFLTVARPIATALEKLEATDGSDDESNESGPDPGEIKCLLEDALVLLGNANARLNQWRQKRFSHYLTDVGKRTLKASLPTDKHLFPDQFHKIVQSEHEHSSTTSKLIAAPPKPSTSYATQKKPFRPNPQHQADRRSWGKRKWSARSGSAYQGTSGSNKSFSNFTTKRGKRNMETTDRS
jgi:hypothetical protein